MVVDYRYITHLYLLRQVTSKVIFSMAFILQKNNVTNC